MNDATKNMVSARYCKSRIYPDAIVHTETDECLVPVQQFYNNILEKSIVSYGNDLTVSQASSVSPHYALQSMKTAGSISSSDISFHAISQTPLLLGPTQPQPSTAQHPSYLSLSISTSKTTLAVSDMAKPDSSRRRGNNALHTCQI